MPAMSSSRSASVRASASRWSTAPPASPGSLISCCPSPSATDREPGKFADLAVPALIDRSRAAPEPAGRRLEAVLAGGARMFALGELDIGARNAAAVRAGLAASGLTVRAAETGGSRGRTMRVVVGDCTVTVKEAGGQLDHAARRLRPRRPPGGRATRRHFQGAQP